MISGWKQAMFLGLLVSLSATSPAWCQQPLPTVPDPNPAVLPAYPPAPNGIVPNATQPPLFSEMPTYPTQALPPTEPQAFPPNYTEAAPPLNQYPSHFEGPMSPGGMAPTPPPDPYAGVNIYSRFWRANRRGNCNRSGCSRALNRCGVDCWAHHDEYGCSSFESEFRFIFGSCRAYFGERCRTRPPVIPTPPGYSLPPGRWR